MKVGDIVRNRLKPSIFQIGIVLEIRENIFVEDIECSKHDFGNIAKVIYPDGNIEVNPIELYEIVSSVKE